MIDTSREPYDRERLYQRLDEIQGYLEELKIIEDVARLAAGRLFNSNLGMVRVTLGRTYPFEVNIPRRLGENLEASLVGIDIEAGRWASDNMASLTVLIPTITDRRAASYGLVDGHLGEVADALRNMPDDLGHLANNLGDWKGRDAESFADHFHAPFDNVVSNQGWLVTHLRDAVRVCQGVVNLSQRSLMNASAAAVEVLRGRLRRWQDAASQGTDWEQVLLIYSLVSGLLASATFWIPPVSAGLWAVSVTLGFGATLIPEEDAVQHPIGGTSAAEIFDSLFDATTKTLTNSRLNYEELETRLQALAAQVDQRWSDRRSPMYPPRPDIVDRDPDEFYHRSSNQYA